MPKIPKPEPGDLYMGIDPGVSGGLACVHHDGVVDDISAMPSTERDTLEWFGLTNDVICIAVIEWINPAIQAIGKSSMSKLYGNYMQLRGFLIAQDISFEAAKPYEWQRALSIPPRKKTENTSKWKNRLKGKAQELFPGVDITLKTADALLIAEFCRRKHRGLL